jgi:hypothetical protein
VARHSVLVGKVVKVEYRTADLQLPASGTLVHDSGKSIYIEEHFVQCGKPKTLRVGIPYQCIVRISERPNELDASSSSAETSQPIPQPSLRTNS